MEMLTGDASFHFHDFFPQDRIKSLELVKTSKWNVHFPFGISVWEFWSTFHEIPFSEKISVRGRPTKLCYSKKLPYIKTGIFKLLVLEKIEIYIVDLFRSFNICLVQKRAQNKRAQIITVTYLFTNYGAAKQILKLIVAKSLWDKEPQALGLKIHAAKREIKKRDSLDKAH